MNYIFEFLTQSNIVAGIIGAFIVWIIAQVKSVAEINKIDKEVINIRIFLNKELYVLEEQKKGHFQKIHLYLKELLDAIKEDKSPNLPEIWDKINNSFFIDYLESSYQIIRTSKILFSGNKKDMKDFIDDELFPLLKTSVEILALLNDSRFKELNRDRETLISDTTFKLVFRTIKRNITIIDFHRRKKIKLYEEALERYKIT